MKNKNICFVGYYHGIENKEKFTELFECKDKYFLENDVKYTHFDDFTTYYPPMLYKYHGKQKMKLNDTYVNLEYKNLYKRDFKYFQSGKQIKAKSLKKYKVLILDFLVHKYINKYKNNTKFNPLNLIKFLKGIHKEIQQNNPNLLQALRKYRFRKNFMKGHAYAKRTLDTLNWNKDDIYVLWGKSQSSYQLLISYLKENGIEYYIVEYGEIPGTIALSKDGIFGEYFTDSSWQEFVKKPITSDEIRYATAILETIKQHQISTKSYENNMFFLMKYFWDNSVHLENRPKIVYVNGSELFASGYYSGRWGVDNKGQNPNKMLLSKVVNFFDNTYMIMYKEHPMTLQNNVNSLISPSDFPTVNFINGFSIHDTLEISDIVITLPSKVAITSLLYGKPTFVLGDFTIPSSVDSMNYYTSRNFEDIGNMVSYEDMVLGEEFISFIAKMLKYNLIIYDKELYVNYNEEDEKTKIKNILFAKEAK